MTGPKPRPEIFTVHSYIGGESKLPGVDRVIKLSSNEGAFGAPPEAIAAITQSGAMMHRYPDGGMTALRNAIGKAYAIDPARIVCGTGSDEILQLLIQAYGGPGTELIMSAHGFSIYEIAGKVNGCVVRKAAEKNLTTDIDAVLALVTPATRMVFIANPNNPTGSLVSNAEMQRLRDQLPPDVLLVIDAAYAEYVEQPDYDGGISMVDARINTVMTRTFSKIYGLGGARLGWGYAPAPIADVLNRLRGPFNVSITAAAAGIAALEVPGWVNNSRAHNSRARKKLAQRLTAAGLIVYPSEANFLLVDFLTSERAAEADKHLRARGIIVRHVRSYGLPTCLRVTIGTDAECDLVAESLIMFQTMTEKTLVDG